MKAYETSVEARREAQLKTEETIADLKILNGFEINDDESVMPPELVLEIESIQKTSDELIEKNENYEQILISESESAETKARVNEIFADLDGKINLTDHLIKLVDSGSLKEKEMIKKARQKLNKKPNLTAIKDKINFLPFNAKKIDFFENKQDVSKSGNAQKIGKMIIKETIGIDKLNIFKFEEVEFKKITNISKKSYSFYVEYLTIPSRLFEILNNGTYVIGGFCSNSQEFHLFIYDPITKSRKNKLTFDERIDELFVSKNKIVLSQRITENRGLHSYKLKIMDENLNVIKETNTDALLKSADDSHLYCILDSKRLALFDWDLNEIKSDVVFQYDDPNQGFYLRIQGFNWVTHQLDPSFSKIIQLAKRSNKYIINFKTGGYKPRNELLIFSELGVLLKKRELENDFVIDSNNNIIVNNSKKDFIYYCDSNGDLFKAVTLKRPKNENKVLKQIKIDSNDKLYFTQ
jgi:hypothetical protein